ncbi:hypothetical protein JCM9279_003422 [Rhodotorula babjevae]
MSSILDGLDALSISHSPFTWPLRGAVPRASSSESSSTHQAFPVEDDIDQVIFSPDLATDLWTCFRAALAAALDGLERTRGPPRPEATAAVDAGLDAVQAALDAYFGSGGATATLNEAVVESEIRTLVKSLHALVPALDVLIDYDHDHHGAAVESQMHVPASGPDIAPPRRRRGGGVRVDLMLCRASSSSPDPQTVPLLSLELKSPHASQGCHEDRDSTVQRGLFVRLEDVLKDHPALSWADVAANPALASLHKKELHVARTYGHDLFLLADGYSFMVAALVERPPALDAALDPLNKRFDVFISRLERIAPAPPSPNLFLLALLAAFYPNLLKIKTVVSASASTAAQHAHAATAQIGSALRRSARLGAATSVHPSHELCMAFPDGTGLGLHTHRFPPTWLSPSPSSSSPSSASSTPRRESPSSSAPPSPLSATASTCVSDALIPGSPRPLNLSGISLVQLDYLLSSSRSAHVYACAIRSRPCVVKVSRRGFDDALEREAALLCAPEIVRLARAGDAVCAVGVAVSDEGQVVVFQEDAGDALNGWDDLSNEPRVSLVLSVLRLHQLAHLFHGDLAPRNVAVPPPTSSSSSSPSTSTASPPSTPKPRLIDLGHAYEHEQPCTGRACAEVRQLVRELALEPLELDEVGRRAASEGLVW